MNTDLDSVNYDILEVINERDRLLAVNAQLLRACESALNAMCIGANADETMLQACEVIRAAIAQAEQGAKGQA